MFYIPKPLQAPTAFSNIVEKYNSYDALTESILDRDALKLLLLNEQGCLCPYCEKRLSIATATVEHFLPESSFPHLQLAHLNLYACCHICNGHKTNHLIPAYIFDQRLDCFNNESLLIKRSIDFNLRYFLEGTNNIFLAIPHLSKLPKQLTTQYHADNILYHTLTLLDLNNHQKLLTHRYEAWISFLREINSSSTQKLQQTFQALKSKKQDDIYWKCEEHISMKLFFLAEKLRKQHALV